MVNALRWPMLVGGALIVLGGLVVAAPSR